MSISAKIGFGGKVNGEAVVLGKKSEDVTSHQISSFQKGKILVFLETVGREVLEKAGLIGVAGVVLPAMHYRDFEYFQKLNEFPILVLVKFGSLELSDREVAELAKLSGRGVTLDGEKKILATQ